MAKILAEPRRPLDDWQRKLNDWLAEVEGIVSQAEVWAAKREWATKRDQRVVTEEVIGTYEVPTLLIHTPQGRLLLDPIARFIVGAAGRFDFCVMPSYDSVPLVKVDNAWGFWSISRKELRLPWSEEAFEKVALELLKMQ